MYGTNPHGQGTVAGVQLNPSTNLPYPYDAGGKGANETLVVGRGRGEQNPDGTYHAHTTIAALLGTELIGVDAPQGQSNTGPLNAVQTGILDMICKSSNSMICLTVLAADTIASASGASTRFSIAHATIGGANGLDAGAAESTSSIATSGSCQTASGGSQVANVALAGGQVAGVARSSESSVACAGQTPTQKATSSVISLGGTGVGIPAPGCANGTPNTVGGIPTLLPIICNADDTSQLPAPAGVRQALAVLALQVGSSALLKTVTAASESHAVAPSSSTCTDTDQDCGKGETCDSAGNDPDGDADCTGGGPGKCTDTDKDCGRGEVCAADGSDPDGDSDCTVSGACTVVNTTNCLCTPGQSNCTCTSSGCKCTDADADCGKGPAGTGTCTNDTSDNDGDCVLPGGGSETGAVSGAQQEAAAETATESANAGKLPFTGENVLEVLLVGLLLASGGLALSLRTRRKGN